MRSRVTAQFVLVVGWCLAAVSLAAAHPLTVAGFNVESGQSDITAVAKRVGTQKDVDLWGFSEVLNASWAETLRKAVAGATGHTARAIVGTTGGDDRLTVVVNESTLEYVRHFELRSVVVKACGEKFARAPLVVELKHRATGRRLWFMVNHLQRTDTAYRHCQARTLNAWVKSNTVAMIAVGDYNFDWDIASHGAKHDTGLDLLTANARFRWIRPTAPLVRTQCGFNSILDFIFVTARAQTWPGQARILFAGESEYCTRAPEKDSDHRPVTGRLELQ